MFLVRRLKMFRFFFSYGTKHRKEPVLSSLVDCERRLSASRVEMNAKERRL
jgi:hypothetical protein